MISPCGGKLKPRAHCRLGGKLPRGKARINSDAIPELVKNFKRDVLNQPF
jgi:hypothetical protein